MTDQTNDHAATAAAEPEEGSAAGPAARAPRPSPTSRPRPPRPRLRPRRSPRPRSPCPTGPARQGGRRGRPPTGAAPDGDEPDKAAEYLELARRTQADFDNYRKRMARENAAAADRGASKLAKELLPALDHLDLALKAASGHEDVVRGFAMVHGELIAALGRVGIQSFSPQGETFDPSEHEAMAQRPVEGAESGTVVEVYQQGYRINGTVLRPARVVVAQ